jgi:hypothetical protein
LRAVERPAEAQVLSADGWVASYAHRSPPIAPDINALEPTLTRYGYNVKALSELLNVRVAEVRALLYGQLPEERTAELKQQILKPVYRFEHRPPWAGCAVVTEREPVAPLASPCL